MTERVAVVGDVHGMIVPLRLAAGWILDEWDTDVVFVGDYINRGPDSYQVIEELVSLNAKLGSQLTLLLGNHELALLEFLEHGNDRSFLMHGGVATVFSYLQSQMLPIEDYPMSRFRDTFPETHLQLLQSMKLWYETNDLLVTHSGYNPLVPESRKAEDITLGRHPTIFDVHRDGPRPLVVFGHYAQRTAVPYMSENLICVDTGCGLSPQAPLTVLTLPDRKTLTFGGLDG